VSELLNATDAARKLGWSRYGLYKLVARYGVPHIRIGDSMRFDPADLDAWVKLQKMKAHTCTTCGQHLRRLRKVG
jgi:excisionase family DNA binding protein